MPNQAIDPTVEATMDSASKDPLDWTDRYNTPLTPKEESAFQSWLFKAKKALDLRDYDLRGAWRDGVARDGRGHLPDTWKKPNHPTFSEGSIYSGVDGFEGGIWRELAPKKWAYRPSATNLRLHGADGLSEYFRQREPTAKLHLDDY